MSELFSFVVQQIHGSCLLALWNPKYPQRNVFKRLSLVKRSGGALVGISLWRNKVCPWLTYSCRYSGCHWVATAVNETSSPSFEIGSCGLWGFPRRVNLFKFLLYWCEVAKLGPWYRMVVKILSNCRIVDTKSCYDTLKMFSALKSSFSCLVLL